MSRSRPASPLGTIALPAGTGGRGKGAIGGIWARIRSAKEAVEHHVVWVLKAGLALICGTAAAGTIIGIVVNWVFYGPLWVIFWIINNVCGFFEVAPIGYPIGIALKVIFWLMAGWAIVGTGWDWQCDRGEQWCLLLMCSVALTPGATTVGAVTGGTTGQFASWLIGIGGSLSHATLGQLLGG